MAIILAAVAWLLTYLVHSTVLLAGALALAGLGLVRSHAARDTLWKVALLGGLMTATAQIALRLQPYAGHVALAAHQASPFVAVAGIRNVAPPVRTRPDVEFDGGADFAAAVAGSPSADEAAAAPVRTVTSLVENLHIGWPAMLLQFWFVGAVAFVSRLLWARVALARELRSRRPIVAGPLAETLTELAGEAGVAAPRLSVSDDLSGPIAFGGEIVLPHRVLTHLAPSEQRAVIAHELGHVARRDPAWLMVALAIESVCFVQPLNRLARRRLRAESEFLCDDWAAERSGGIVLARCLAEVAGWVQSRPMPAAAVGMAGHCSQLVSRVERLLEGDRSGRPTRWVVRAAAGALALGLVASVVPGVAAEDLDGAASASASVSASASDQSYRDAKVFDVSSLAGTDAWGELRDDGRLIVFAPGFSGRLRGHGRLGFREWGRAIVVPDGYEVRVNGTLADGDEQLCEQSAVRLVETDGEGGWDLMPVRLPGAPQFAEGSRDRDADVLTRATLRVALAGVRSADKDDERDAATDDALDGQADAAIDTLVQLWVQDPEAVRRAARRIARTYDRELRPQFESLGVEVGRQLAPQLQRLTDRVGRDLAPEFARFGAALGASIISSLGELPEAGAGSGDYRTKTKPKNH